jgi:hypothetical protein
LAQEKALAEPWKEVSWHASFEISKKAKNCGLAERGRISWRRDEALCAVHDLEAEFFPSLFASFFISNDLSNSLCLICLLQVKWQKCLRLGFRRTRLIWRKCTRAGDIKWTVWSTDYGHDDDRDFFRDMQRCLRESVDVQLFTPFLFQKTFTIYPNQSRCLIQ